MGGFFGSKRTYDDVELLNRNARETTIVHPKSQPIIIFDLICFTFISIIFRSEKKVSEFFFHFTTELNISNHFSR